VDVVAASSGNLGVFTPGGVETGGANGYTYTLSLDDGTNSVNVVDTVAASGTGSAATFATALTTAGFTADGTTVSGFTVSYGGQASAAAALTAGTLSFSRADGVNFDVDEAFGGTGTPTSTAGFGAAGNINLTTTNGVEAEVADTLTLSNLTVQVGSATAVTITGTYDNAQDLVDDLNSQVPGLYASYDSTSHVISVSSGEALTFGGSDATTLGFANAAVGGSLNTQNVSSVAGANSTIQSVDSALTAVSDLRSTLGAIQNRFQSVINSLQAVSENLSASRSRILDTDFAAETASLTRAQILQQAGTAMVAQANSAPQNVLSLLRG
jgi:flagellin